MLPIAAEVAAGMVIDKVFDKSNKGVKGSAQFNKYKQLDKIIGEQEQLKLDIEHIEHPVDEIINDIGRGVIDKDNPRSLYDSLSSDNKKMLESLYDNDKKINKNVEEVAEGIETINKNIDKLQKSSELYNKMGLEGMSNVGGSGDGSILDKIIEIGVGLAGVWLALKALGSFFGFDDFLNFNADRKFDKVIDKKLKESENAIKSMIVPQGPTDGGNSLGVIASDLNNKVNDTGNLAKGENKLNIKLRKSSSKDVKKEIEDLERQVEESKKEYKVNTRLAIKSGAIATFETEDAMNEMEWDEQSNKLISKSTVDTNYALGLAENYQNEADKNKQNIKEFESYKDLVKKLYESIVSIKGKVISSKGLEKNRTIASANALLYIINKDQEALVGIYKSLKDTQLNNLQFMQILKRYYIEDYASEGEGTIKHGKLDFIPKEDLDKLVIELLNYLGIRGVDIKVYNKYYSKIKEMLGEFATSSFRLVVYFNSVSENTRKVKQYAGLQVLKTFEDFGIDEYYEQLRESDSSDWKDLKENIAREFENYIGTEAYEDFLKRNGLTRESDVNKIFSKMGDLKDRAIEQVFQSKDFRDYYYDKYKLTIPEGSKYDYSFKGPLTDFINKTFNKNEPEEVTSTYAYYNREEGKSRSEMDSYEGALNEAPIRKVVSELLGIKDGQTLIDALAELGTGSIKDANSAGWQWTTTESKKTPEVNLSQEAYDKIFSGFTEAGLVNGLTSQNFDIPTQRNAESLRE